MIRFVNIITKKNYNKKMSKDPTNRFPHISQCDSEGRENHTVVADMDGTLLVGRSSFPYFALVAFDVGGILRLLLLVLATPLIGFLYHFVSESAGIRLMIFVTFAGVRVSAIKSAANAVLPKHYAEDVHPETWRVVSSCGRKCVLTANPRIMVEPFLKNYMGVDIVLGTEISSFKGIATGLVDSSGVNVGPNKAVALVKAFGTETAPGIGIGDRETDFPFMKICKEGYLVPPIPDVRPLKPNELPKPVIFHDGRLVKKPSPLDALILVLWFPFAFILSVIRFFIGSLCPIKYSLQAFRLVGVKTTIKGKLPDAIKQPTGGRGVAVVCQHRNVLDACFVSFCIGRMTTTISYSVASINEMMSPIESLKLTRDRQKDAQLISDILNAGKCLVMCPEGTTCREPYLLRFSSLFAELTDQIVPVAIEIKASMFHGTSARGQKFMDPFYLFMNSAPEYVITFLDKLPLEKTCSGGLSSHEVANTVQQIIGKAINYECTNLTRKDKYRALAGTDGIVGQKPIKVVESG